jgi:hypothetical protein
MRTLRKLAKKAILSYSPLSLYSEPPNNPQNRQEFPMISCSEWRSEQAPNLRTPDGAPGRAAAPNDAARRGAPAQVFVT